MVVTDKLMPEFALYHPWPPLDGRTLGGWVKTMLLFFDGVAILAPPLPAQAAVEAEEEVFGPLMNDGVFRVLDPEDMIGREEADAVLEFLFAMAAELEEKRDNDARWLTSLIRNGGYVFSSRTMLRHRDRLVRGTAAVLWESLTRSGIASKPDAEGSIRMDPMFWSLYQAFLAQAVHGAGLRKGIDLQPATDDMRQGNPYRTVLDAAVRPSSGHVVAFDLQQVALDMSLFELADVLRFRDEHGREFRRYARDLREFAATVALADDRDRVALLRERHDALADTASDLRRTNRGWWGRAAASIGVGISGAAWSATRGEWPAAAVSLLGGVVGMGAEQETNSAFSYLFKAEKTFASRR